MSAPPFAVPDEKEIEQPNFYGYGPTIEVKKTFQPRDETIIKVLTNLLTQEDCKACNPNFTGFMGKSDCIPYITAKVLSQQTQIDILMKQVLDLTEAVNALTKKSIGK